MVGIDSSGRWEHKALPLISAYIGGARADVELMASGGGHFVLDTGKQKTTDFGLTYTTRRGRTFTVPYGELSDTPVGLKLVTNTIHLPGTAEERKHKLVPFYETRQQGEQLAVSVGHALLQKCAMYTDRLPKGRPGADYNQDDFFFKLISSRL